MSTQQWENRSNMQPGEHVGLQMLQLTHQIWYYRQSFAKYMGYVLFGGWGLLIVVNKAKTLKTFQKYMLRYAIN